MRRKVTSLLLVVGTTAGTAGWLLLRSGAEQPALASPTPCSRLGTLPCRLAEAGRLGGVGGGGAALSTAKRLAAGAGPRAADVSPGGTTPALAEAPGAPLVVPPAEVRLAAADPEAVPADPFQPVPTSAVPAPVAGTAPSPAGGDPASVIGPVLPTSTPPEPASFIRLNSARPAAAPAALTAAVATPHGPAAARSKAAPAASPVARATPWAVQAAGPAPHAPAQAAPSNDVIHLKGIIRGTPDVALVCCGDQTYFVKAGERLAGAWKVLEIKDNSAVLRNGDRVLELQIEGGS